MHRCFLTMNNHQSFDDYFNKNYKEYLEKHTCKEDLSKLNITLVYLGYELRKLGIHLGIPNTCFMCHKGYVDNLKKMYVNIFTDLKYETVILKLCKYYSKYELINQ